MKSKRASLLIEQLESRRMLAVYDGTTGLTNGPDTVTINALVFSTQVIINGTTHTTSDQTITINTLGGNDVISVADTRPSSNIVVNGGSGDDVLQGTTGNLDDAFENFQFLGGSGFDTVIADNTTGTENTATFRVQGSGIFHETLNKFLINWTGTENVSFRDNNNPNTLRFVNLGDITHLEVRMNGGSDFVRNFLEGQPGNVGTSFGSGGVFVDTGTGSGDKIDLDNRADQAGASFLVNSTSVDVTSPLHNTGPLTYLNCETLNVTGTTHSDSFTVNSKPTSMVLGVFGDNGADTFTVGGGDIDSNGFSLFSQTDFFGDAGTDSIRIDDHLDAEGEIETYTVGTSQTLQPAIAKGSAGFEYAFETLTLDVADAVNTTPTPNFINIHATPIANSLQSFTINAPGTLRDTSIGMRLETVNSVPETFTLNTPGATVELLGSGVFRHDFVVDKTQVRSPVDRTVNYFGVSEMSLHTTIDADNIDVNGIPAGMALSINAGDGSFDTITLGSGNVDADLLGSVHVDGDDGDLVIIDNTDDTSVESQVLNGSTFIDGQAHTFATIKRLTINEGPGGTNLAVNATSCQTFINGGTGNDSFTVGGGDINSNLQPGELLALDIDGGGGNDQILFNDLNDNTLDTYILNSPLGADRLVKEGAILPNDYYITWSAVESVTLDASNAPTFAGNPSTIIVAAMVTPLRIRGNAGSDRIFITDAVAPVFVHTGLGDADQLIVNSDFVPGDAPVVVVFDQTDDVEVLDISQGGTVRVLPGVVLVKTRLNATPGLLNIAGVLDLAGGAFLSTAGGPSPEFFRGLLSDGFNSGTWNGTSTSGAINSSLAAGPSPNDAVGYGFGSEIAINSIGGFIIADNDVLIRYAMYGDTDLNGVVNFDDYARTDAGFNFGRTGWVNGDFDYNNTVNFDDYALIDLAFLNQGTGRPGHSKGGRS